MEAVVIDGIRRTSVPQSRLEALIMLGYGGGTGTDDYTRLINKPKINGVELIGDVSLEDLGINNDEMSAEDLENMWGD